MKKIVLKTNQNNPAVKAYKAAIRQGSSSQHVLPKGNEWIVRRAGAEKATRTFNTQNEATTFAKSVAKNQGTAVYIHGTNGRIRDRV